jgi:hypothetical protein
MRRTAKFPASRKSPILPLNPSANVGNVLKASLPSTIISEMLKVWKLLSTKFPGFFNLWRLISTVISGMIKVWSLLSTQFLGLFNPWRLISTVIPGMIKVWRLLWRQFRGMSSKGSLPLTIIPEKMGSIYGPSGRSLRNAGSDHREHDVRVKWDTQVHAGG